MRRHRGWQEHEPSNGGVYTASYGLTFVNPPNLMPEYNGDKARPWTKGNLAYRLKKFFTAYSWSAITEERTALGVPHYHVFVKSNHAAKITSAKLMEAFGCSAHFHRADIHFVEYFTEDVSLNLSPAAPMIIPTPNVIPRGIHLDGIGPEQLQSQLKADSKKKETGLFERISTSIVSSDVSLAEIRAQYPAFMAQHGGKIAKFYGDVRADRAAREADQKRVSFQFFSDDDFAEMTAENRVVDHEIASYLNQACVRNEKNEPELLGRNCHLWIEGQTEIGKSRLLAMLRKQFKCYDYEFTKAGWQDRWNPEVAYDFVLIDEFKINLEEYGITGSHFNHMLDGTNQVDQRYVGAVQRMARLPWICTANRSIQKCFEGYKITSIGTDAATLTAIQTRFTTIHAHQPITLFKHLWDKINYTPVRSFITPQGQVWYLNTVNNHVYRISYPKVDGKTTITYTRISAEDEERLNLKK